MAVLCSLAVGAAIAPHARAVDSRNISVIENFPTNLKTGSSSTNGSWAYLLDTPLWPGTNTCEVDGGAPRPCSWVIEMRVATGKTGTLKVTQTRADGSVTVDSASWVHSPKTRDSGLAPQAYCQLTTGPVKAVSDWYSTQDVTTLWGVYNDRPTPIDLSGRNAYADPTLNPSNPTVYRAGTVSSFLYDGRTGRFNPIYSPLPQTPPVFAPGESAPFPTATVTGIVNGIQDRTPSIRISNGIDSFGVDVPNNYASCFRVISPSTIIDNGDGSYSATFGWVNLMGDPLSIRAGASGPWGMGTMFGHATRRIGLANQLRTPSGSSIDDAGQPTYFPASSLGTWTYTWKDDGSLYRSTDAGKDPVLPFEWRIAGETAGFYVRRSLATHHTQAPTPISPFTHIDPSTPATTPAIPIALPSRSGDGTTTAPTSLSGSHSGAATTTTLTLGRTRPRAPIAKARQVVRVDYTIRNAGSSEAIGGELCETVPRGTIVLAAPGRHRVSARRYCWASHRLAAGSAVQGHLLVRFPAHLAGRAARIRVTVKYDNATRVTRTLTYGVRGGRGEPVTG